MKRKMLVVVAALMLLPVAAAALTEEESQQLQEKIDALPWHVGTGEHELRQSNAKVSTGEGEAFMDAEAANEFMRLTQGHDRFLLDGLIYNLDGLQAHSFVTFEYDETGYVEMDDWDEVIDAEGLLDSIQAGTKAATENLAESYEKFHVDGWVQEPYLDRDQQVVFWAITGHNDSGQESINARALKLGRKGMAMIEWVGAPEQFESVDVVLTPTLQAFDYQQGFRYADFDPEVDAVAAVGIGAIAYQMMTGEAAAGGIVVGALLLLKKFWWAILIPFAFVMRWLKGRGRGKEAQ